MNGRKWLHGLLAAFVGGAAGAADSGLALVLIDPDHFNVHEGLWRMLITTAVLGALTGAKCAAAYLKQSPVPPDWDGLDRRSEPSEKHIG